MLSLDERCCSLVLHHNRKNMRLGNSIIMIIIDMRSWYVSQTGLELVELVETSVHMCLGLVE